jgi:hypothetical protein
MRIQPGRGDECDWLLNRCHPQFFFSIFGALFEAFSPVKASRGIKHLEIFGTLPRKAPEKFQ